MMFLIQAGQSISAHGIYASFLVFYSGVWINQSNPWLPKLQHKKAEFNENSDQYK